MLRKIATLFIALLFCGQSLWAQGYNSTSEAQKGREFLMSCTYGILTGTLLGAASLAFTNKPGEKLHRVARGASLGLYAGIALGMYVTSSDELAPEQGYSYPPELAPQKSSFFLIPLFNEKGVDGLQLQFHLKSF